MASRSLSLQIALKTLDRLEDMSQRTGQTPSELAMTLIEEGLRMAAHPRIVFRSGPMGRRPGLADGSDVWEIARVFRGRETLDERDVDEAVALTGLRPDQVGTAFRYYTDFREEIETWINRVDEEATQAEEAWHRQRALVRQ
jgi:hypothetical protein